MKRILITGGAGFIGSAVVRYIINEKAGAVCNVDKLTYASSLSSVEEVANSPLYHFERADICDAKVMQQIFADFQPDTVMHLAAESHVDRSIKDPGVFMQTNIMGTFVLLEAALRYWQKLPLQKKSLFRFHHVSTDEVYGDLHGTEYLFTETTAYTPSSPYSASKASSDHLVRAWQRTYGLPTVVSNCSNNYGPFHFPDKLIPLTILNALEGKPLPLYGGGQQIRDWLYVEDHARALYKVATESEAGASYNIGGNSEKTNIEVVKNICAILEELVPNKPKNVKYYEDLITFVPDRLGHDLRYAIDATKISQELGWQPLETFESGIRKTVKWYLNNKNWWKTILAKYKQLESDRTSV